MADEITEALEKIFSVDSVLYQERGFQRRIGFGERPALLNIDLANAWTRPGNAFSCENMDVIIPAVQALLTASRAAGIPIVFTTTAYDVTASSPSDMGLWHKKIPVELLCLVGGGTTRCRLTGITLMADSESSTCAQVVNLRATQSDKGTQGHGSVWE